MPPGPAEGDSSATSQAVLVARSQGTLRPDPLAGKRRRDAQNDGADDESSAAVLRRRVAAQELALQEACAAVTVKREMIEEEVHASQGRESRLRDVILRQLDGWSPCSCCWLGGVGVCFSRDSRVPEPHRCREGGRGGAGDDGCC